MGLSLKERRVAESLRKEQKRAERVGVETLATGAEIIAKLRKGRQISDSDLQRMSRAVDVFRSGGEELEQVKAKLKLRDRVLYNMVESDLRGEWMESFARLIAAIPQAKRFRPFAIDWAGWREIGAHAGMNEEQIVEALKVMLIFRDR